MILKNTASQGVYLFASNKTTGAGLAGDQANITGAVSKDGAAEASFATAPPTNIGGGVYWQPLSQAETDCNAFGMRWASSTADILIEPLVGFTDQGRIDAAVSSRMATFTYTAPPTADTITTAVWAGAPAGTPLEDISAQVWADAPASTPLADVAAAVVAHADFVALVAKAVAIQAKTDNLPASPAAVGSAMILSATGLDAIPMTAPTGLATDFRGAVIQTWRRFFKKATKTSSAITTYADNGSTVVTTQTVSDDGTTETQGAAS